MTGVYIARKQATTRHAIDAAYRVSSPPTNGGGDWRRGPRAAHSIGVEGSDSAPGPETYGFTNSEGLPAFVGQLVSATAAGAATAPAPGAAAAALMLAQACEARMLSFVEHHRWDQELLPTVETALRLIVLDHTPKHRDQAFRLGAMARLKDLAQSGIHFCVGLDLEPYGSFVSGLYTPLGDLDLSIEGQASWRDDAGRPQQVTVDRMEREMKVKFLRAMASRIQAKRLSLGPVERILFARVPILKFKDTSGLDFDVAIGGSNALFKSAMLGLLAQYDWRFGALVRLVKAWARRFDVNDSANGSLNSFALTLMVVFHLQTRSPPVLPPLCDLCGMPPTADRPMQEGRYPDWRLLQLAGRKLCELRQADEQGAGSANSETLLELLASFFALYHGLASLGAAALVGDGISEAVPQQALEGVLKRVRVDTWAGRLRYERWDREGYLMSVEDPFDSTDNCARTVRAKEKAAQIAAAVAEGRSLLLHLDNASLFEEQLWQLFGPVAVRPIDAALQQPGAAVQWVRPVDLIIPPRIQTYTVGAIPCPAPVAHRRQRGGGKAGIVAAAEAAAVQRQLEALARDQQQGSAAAAAAAGMQKARVGEPPPPSGLAPPSPLHGDSAEGVAVLPGNGGLAGASSDSLAGTNSGAAVEEGTASSTMQLYCLILPEVVEEAARLAEIDRLAFEALAASAAAKKARKAAKRAAAEAAKESKAAERQRLREQRGRSQSKGSGGSRGGSRDGSRGGSRGGRSRSVSAAAAPLSTEAAVAASANLGSLALSSSGSSARQQPVAQPAVSAPAAAPEPAQGMLQQRGSSGSSTAAALANIGAGAPAATEGLGAASEALPPGGATGGATAAAAEAPTALAAAQAAARAAGGGKGKGKGKGRAGKRSPGNMKAAVEEPKGRQMAQTEGSSLAAALAVASQATAAASMALMGGRGGAGRGRQQPPQQQQQQAAGPGAVTAGRQPGRGRGRGRGQRAPGGDVASEARVLTVQRPAASSRPPQPPPPPPSGC